MKPYFEQDGIIVYHGDLRDVLPQLGRQCICIELDEHNCEIIRERLNEV